MAPPATLMSVIGLLPATQLKQVKRMLTGGKYNLYDLPYRLASRYVPSFLLLMISMSFATSLFIFEIRCESGNSLVEENGRLFLKHDKDLDNYCWATETFLVRKHLAVTRRGDVLFPGIGSYNREEDELISQWYYKHFWLCLGTLFLIAYIPHVFWKADCTKKLDSLIKFTEVPNVPRYKTMVSYFIECRGLNNAFAVKYFSSKFLVLFTILLQWITSVKFFGNDFLLYGVDVVLHSAGFRNEYPDPMVVVFPFVAKCEQKWVGIGGDFEYKAAICQLPINNIARWVFLFYWWILAILFVCNLIMIIKLLFMLHACVRFFWYRPFVKKTCREDVDIARTYEIVNNQGVLASRQVSKDSVIRINIRFSDWLILDFMSKNMKEHEFREFIRELALTENTMIKLVPVQLQWPYCGPNPLHLRPRPNTKATQTSTATESTEDTTTNPTAPDLTPTESNSPSTIVNLDSGAQNTNTRPTGLKLSSEKPNANETRKLNSTYRMTQAEREMAAKAGQRQTQATRNLNQAVPLLTPGSSGFGSALKNLATSSKAKNCAKSTVKFASTLHSAAPTIHREMSPVLGALKEFASSPTQEKLVGAGTTLKSAFTNVKVAAPDLSVLARNAALDTIALATSSENAGVISAGSATVQSLRRAGPSRSTTNATATATTQRNPNPTTPAANSNSTATATEENVQGGSQEQTGSTAVQGVSPQTGNTNAQSGQQQQTANNNAQGSRQGRTGNSNARGAKNSGNSKRAPAKPVVEIYVPKFRRMLEIRHPVKYQRADVARNVTNNNETVTTIGDSSNDNTDSGETYVNKQDDTAYINVPTNRTPEFDRQVEELNEEDWDNEK